MSIRWRSMKTAPRDGTEILLWVEGCAITGSWDARSERWCVDVLPSHGCGCCADSNDPPDAWSPISPPACAR